MTVVTISRQIGSEGTLIGTQAAKLLDYHLADKDTMEWIVRQYGLMQFEDVYADGPGLWSLFDWNLTATTRMLARTIQALAAHGNVVIIGRGSYAALRGLADVLNVRIQAPRPARLQSLMGRHGIAESEAEARLAEADRIRVAFIEKEFGVRFDDASSFDLAIDTANITPELATRWIVEAVGVLGARVPEGRPRAAGFEVSSTLARLVCDALGCDASHG